MAIEWVMPAPRLWGHHFSIFKRLPAGMPEYLHVDIKHSPEGTERSVAAIYSGRAYLIHYQYTLRSDC